jgi:hypothetical protein
MISFHLFKVQILYDLCQIYPKHLILVLLLSQFYFQFAYSTIYKHNWYMWYMHLQPCCIHFLALIIFVDSL